MPNRKFWTFFFPVDRILKYNFYFYFNPVNNKKKNETERQCCFSDNVTVCGKSKNLKLQSIFNFFYQPKHSKSLTEIPKKEGEGSIRAVVFAHSALSPWPGPLRCLGVWEGSESLTVLPRSFTTFWSVFLSSVHYSEQPDFGR